MTIHPGPGDQLQRALSQSRELVKRLLFFELLDSGHWIAARGMIALSLPVYRRAVRRLRLRLRDDPRPSPRSACPRFRAGVGSTPWRSSGIGGLSRELRLGEPQRSRLRRIRGSWAARAPAHGGQCPGPAHAGGRTQPSGGEWISKPGHDRRRASSTRTASGIGRATSPASAPRPRSLSIRGTSRSRSRICSRRRRERRTRRNPRFPDPQGRPAEGLDGGPLQAQPDVAAVHHEPGQAGRQEGA